MVESPPRELYGFGIGFEDQSEAHPTAVLHTIIVTGSVLLEMDDPGSWAKSVLVTALAK